MRAVDTSWKPSTVEFPSVEPQDGGFGIETKAARRIERISEIIKCLEFNCRSNTQEEFIKDLFSRQVITSLYVLGASEVDIESAIFGFVVQINVFMNISGCYRVNH